MAEALAPRVAELHLTIHGSPGEPETGLVARVRVLELTNRTILNRLNLWGGIILGAIAVGGLGVGNISKTLEGVIHAFSASG